MSLTKEELQAHIRSQLIRCSGFDGDEISKARKLALDYYFQRARGDEVAGRSQVVTGDLSAMVEATLAQMMDAFSSDHIAEFDPYGADDENQAQLESDAVQYFVMSKNNGVLELAQSIKDALMLRNGLMKVWVDERSRTFTKTFNNVTPEAISELTHIPNTTVKILNFDPDEHTLSLRITSVRREFRAAALPLENFLYQADWNSLDLQEIPFCAERHVDSRSTLLELGFPKSVVQDLPRMKQPFKIDDAARNPNRLTHYNTPIDSSQDEIEWYECFVLMDWDGDGISERRRICVAGGGSQALLSNDPVNLVPYAAGTAIINPHRFLGISLYDKLKQVQDISTGLTRGLLDNVNTTTKNRMAYLDGKVNVDDISDGRPNGAIRVKANVPDIRAALMPFQVPDTSANILQNIQYLKQVRSEMGGAALDMQTANMQIGGDRMGSQGLDRAYSVVEQLCALMTKLVAISLIRSTFLLAHATLRESFNDPVQIKRQGKWQSPIPTQWQERDCCTVKIGMSAGERARRASALLTMLNMQIQLADKGMDNVLVNLEGFYNTLMEWARVSDIQDPEQYFVDPQSNSAMQAAQSKQQQAQEQQQMQQALMSQSVQMKQFEISLDKYKTDVDTQFKYYNAVLSAEVSEAQIVGKATSDLLTTKAKGKDKATTTTRDEVKNGTEEPSEPVEEQQTVD